MIERHVTFHVHADKIAEFVRFFVEEYRPAMSRMPGFVKVELLVEQADPANYQMAIRFQSQEEAAGWRSSTAHQTLQPRLKDLYQESQLQVYEVIA